MIIFRLQVDVAIAQSHDSDITYSCTHIQFIVNNPVISIPQQTLVDQVNSLGAPVTMALNSQAFADVAPLGLVIPDAGQGGPVPGNNGAATMFLTITSFVLMLVASIFC